MKDNLIYFCLFHNKSYINLADLLLNTLKLYGEVNYETTDVLIMTHSDYKQELENITNALNIPAVFMICKFTTLMQAGCARLYIFGHKGIEQYKKILYLDTDILINKNINSLFELEIDSTKLYALEENTIGSPYNGGNMFDFKVFNRDTPAYTTGILLFMNSPEIKLLFNKILNHIQLDKIKRIAPVCLDQPYIIYHSFINNHYDNQLLKTYVINMYFQPINILVYNLNLNNSIYKMTDKIIYHFPNNPGDSDTKYAKMSKSFMHKLLSERCILNN